MVNIKLLYSSTFFGIILLFFCNEYYSNDNNLLICITLLGIFTSILNHISKYKVFKYLDRATMVIGFIIILYISIQKKLIISILGIIIATFLYFLSKYTGNNLYHIFTHLLITIIIIFLLILSHLMETNIIPEDE